MRQKKYHITTFGCQANLADTEKITEIFEQLGSRRAKLMKEADFLVFNTCSVKQKAEDRVFGLNKKLRELKIKSASRRRRTGRSNNSKTRWKL